MELLGPILEIVNKMWTPISKCLKYHRSLDENMENLKRKLEGLNSRKGDIESKLRVELSSRKNPKEEVEFWLREVRRINGEIETIEGEVGKGKYLSRARLGKYLAKKIQEVEELHQKGSFFDGLVVDAPPRNGEILPTTKLAGETTAKRKMEEIWACLMNDDARTIGVYGMRGSGKTTIMKHINNRIVKESDKYDSVIWVTVSKALDVIKLQNDIASALDVDILKYEDETTRAAKLFTILREKKRFMLILDDMWEAFHLEVVGIPEPTLDNGCKIVLTTRSLDVCRRMNCKNIKMEPLSEDEAWNLFLDTVGRDVLLTPSLEAAAKLVAEECSCLPLAIITIAGSMKGIADEFEWRNALEELKESTKGLNDMGKVLEQLKYSYFRLKDEKLQHSLLYCALYPEDYEIKRKELIEYLIVEGIIEGMRSRQAEIDKGHSILNKLEDACLLESCTNYKFEKCVKMHDLIRDMALQISRRGCMVEAGVRLRDLPEEVKWTEDLKRVSLMNNYVREIRSGASPRCSRLSTLLLLKNENLERIPNSFFMHMHELKVLDLSYTGIEILPNGVSDLVNLTALLVRGCRHLKYMPSLAKLWSLRKLDLDDTGFEEVPQGMEFLVNLKCLNLKARYLKILPAGILPQLSRLQCLIVNWTSETLKIKAEEVIGLRKLETFAGQFYNLHDFNTYIRSMEVRGPNMYLLQVGSGDRLINFDEEGSTFNKHIGLRNCNISKGGEDPLVLPKDIESLGIEKCHDASSLSDVSSLNSATDFLKFCKIIQCDGIECVFSSSTTLQSLEVLRLSDLRNLHFLFREEGASPPLPPPPPPPGIFSRLKDLSIYHCPNIKKLFTLGLVPHLQNLEGICVGYCEGMEEIIARKADGEGGGGGEEEEEEEEEQEMGESSNHSIVNDNDTVIRITLPKLRDMSLYNLPELKSIFCSRAITVCDSFRELSAYECPKLKRMPLF